MNDGAVGYILLKVCSGKVMSATNIHRQTVRRKLELILFCYTAVDLGGFSHQVLHLLWQSNTITVVGYQLVEHRADLRFQESYISPAGFVL